MKMMTIKNSSATETTQYILPAIFTNHPHPHPRRPKYPRNHNHPHIDDYV